MVDHPPLHFGGATHRVDNAREFLEHAVARVLSDPAPVLFDLRIGQLPEMRFEAFVRRRALAGTTASITCLLYGMSECSGSDLLEGR